MVSLKSLQGTEIEKSRRVVLNQGQFCTFPIATHWACLEMSRDIWGYYHWGRGVLTHQKCQ